jgi:hypothetical protein
LHHYVQFGASEGRSPNPFFDTVYYLDHYPDAASSGMNPLRHYIGLGAAERRNPSPLFDTGYYLDQNPEVLRSGMNPLLHFIQFGAVEGRAPNPFFSPSARIHQEQPTDQPGTRAHSSFMGTVPSGEKGRIHDFTSAYYLRSHRPPWFFSSPSEQRWSVTKTWRICPRPRAPPD